MSIKNVASGGSGGGGSGRRDDVVVGRRSSDSGNKSVNFSEANNQYQDSNRYDDGELRQSSEFFPYQPPPPPSSSSSSSSQSTREDNTKGQFNERNKDGKPLTKLEQVAAAVAKASQVVTTSVQSSETKWWLKKREAALRNILQQKGLVKILFQEEIQNKNKYHRELSPTGDDCIDLEGLTIILSSPSLGLDLQLSEGSFKWTRHLAKELLEHKHAVDWNTFLSIVQYELENFGQYEQRQQSKMRSQQQRLVQQHQQDEQDEKNSKVSIPLRHIIREKFRGTVNFLIIVVCCCLFIYSTFSLSLYNGDNITISPFLFPTLDQFIFIFQVIFSF
jgi:hypothetical protein